MTAFSCPVVPRGEDRIHTRVSAAHDLEDLERKVATFVEVGRSRRVIRQCDDEGDARVFH